jgi:hypothetical protein
MQTRPTVEPPGSTTHPVFGKTRKPHPGLADRNDREQFVVYQAGEVARGNRAEAWAYVTHHPGNFRVRSSTGLPIPLA